MTGANGHPNPGGDRPVSRIGAVLDALGVYWRNHPDLRLGQIIGNAGHQFSDVDPYVLEDHALLVSLGALPTRRERLVQAEDLCGRHVGLLVENVNGAQTYDAAFGGVFDQGNRVFNRVRPDWLPILMVTHKKNGEVRVRTKITELSLRPGAVIRIQNPDPETWVLRSREAAP